MSVDLKKPSSGVELSVRPSLNPLSGAETEDRRDSARSDMDNWRTPATPLPIGGARQLGNRLVATEANAGVGNRLVATDWRSPYAGPAFEEMHRNLAYLQNLGYRQGRPQEDVDGLNISVDLLTAASVIIAGSPSPHDADAVYHTDGGTIEFKQNMFYSLQSHSEQHQTIMMTYAPGPSRNHIALSYGLTLEMSESHLRALPFFASIDLGEASMMTCGFFPTMTMSQCCVISHNATCRCWFGRAKNSTFPDPSAKSCRTLKEIC